MRPLDLNRQLQPINRKKKFAMMNMNSDKNLKWDKMKYEIMNTKSEVNVMKSIIIT